MEKLTEDQSCSLVPVDILLMRQAYTALEDGRYTQQEQDKIEEIVDILVDAITAQHGARYLLLQLLKTPDDKPGA